MRILSRIAIVLLVLGGLGYGSYSFGRHVLSTRLFGSSVVPNSNSGFSVVDSSRSVTRKTDYKGSAPHVEVQVLDADSAGPGPEAPSLENLRRSTTDRNGSGVSSSVPNATINRAKPRRFDAPDADGFEGSGELRNRDGENRPRRRRRRRRTSESTTSDTSRSRETVARRDSADSNAGSNTSSDSGATVLPESGSSEHSVERSVERSPERTVERTTERSRSRESSGSDSRGERSVTSGSASEERPTRRRRRRVRSTTSSSSSRERSPARDSPVPVSEDSGGSSGGDSPVPQPE